MSESNETLLQQRDNLVWRLGLDEDLLVGLRETLIIVQAQRDNALAQTTRLEAQLKGFRASEARLTDQNNRQAATIQAQDVALVRKDAMVTERDNTLRVQGAVLNEKSNRIAWLERQARECNDCVAMAALQDAHGELSRHARSLETLVASQGKSLEEYRQRLGEVNLPAWEKLQTGNKEKDIALANAQARIRWFQDKVAGLEEQTRQLKAAPACFRPEPGRIYIVVPKYITVALPMGDTLQFEAMRGVTLTF
jgi:hypothetical protein